MSERIDDIGKAEAMAHAGENARNIHDTLFVPIDEDLDSPLNKSNRQYVSEGIEGYAGIKFDTLKNVNQLVHQLGTDKASLVLTELLEHTKMGEKEWNDYYEKIQKTPLWDPEKPLY